MMDVDEAVRAALQMYRIVTAEDIEALVGRSLTHKVANAAMWNAVDANLAIPLKGWRWWSCICGGTALD